MATISLPAQLVRTRRFTLGRTLLAAGRPHEVLLLPDAGHQVMTGAVTEKLLWHQARFLQRHLGARISAP